MKGGKEGGMMTWQGWKTEGGGERGREREKGMAVGMSSGCVLIFYSERATEIAQSEEQSSCLIHLGGGRGGRRRGGGKGGGREGSIPPPCVLTTHPLLCSLPSCNRPQ